MCPLANFVKILRAAVLLQLFGVIHSEIVRTGEIAVAPPDSEQDLVAFGLPAQPDRVGGVPHGLAVDFHNHITALQTGLGGIGILININHQRALEIVRHVELLAHALV